MEFLKRHGDTAAIIASIMMLFFWVNNKFDKINDKFDIVSDKIYALDQKINDLDKRIVRIETILFFKDHQNKMEAKYGSEVFDDTRVRKPHETTREHDQKCHQIW